MRLARALVFLALAAASFASLANDAVERWSLAVDGQRVGEARRARETTRDGSRWRESGSVAIGRPHPTRVTWSVGVSRDRDGAVTRLDYASRIGAMSYRWHGVVTGGALAVHWILPTHFVDETLPLPEGVVFPDARDTAAATASDGAFVELDPATFVQSVALRREDSRVRLTQDGEETVIDFDAAHAVTRTETSFFGARLVWTPCAGASCPPVDGALEDPIARLYLESPFRIPYAAQRGPLRLVLARKDGGALDLPVTDEQAVVADGARRVVTIDAHEPAAVESPSAEELARYLAPNRWVQSDDADVRAFASNAKGLSVHARSASLTALVREHMTGGLSTIGYVDAAQTLKNRDGDCTEFAVLLAAAMRARGIPARIAVGMVYSSRFGGRRDVFAPHSWVQAWDGERWKSYDAALEGFDATHVALAVGDGDPAEVQARFAQLAQLEIVKLGLVRP